MTLNFADELKLVIYTASSDYETYDFSVNDKRYIGMGSGELAILDKKN